MKYRSLALVLVAVLAANVSAYHAFQLSSAGSSMTSTAQAYLETLEPAANPQRTSTGDLTEAAQRGIEIIGH